MGVDAKCVSAYISFKNVFINVSFYAYKIRVPFGTLLLMKVYNGPLHITDKEPCIRYLGIQTFWLSLFANHCDLIKPLRY